MAKGYGNVGEALPSDFARIRVEELKPKYTNMLSGLFVNSVICKMDVPLPKKKGEDQEFEIIPVGFVAGNGTKTLWKFRTLDKYDPEGLLSKELRGRHAVSRVRQYAGSEL